MLTVAYQLSCLRDRYGIWIQVQTLCYFETAFVVFFVHQLKVLRTKASKDLFANGL